MTRSTYPFCQGDRGATGRSRIPIAATLSLKHAVISLIFNKISLFRNLGNVS